MYLIKGNSFEMSYSCEEDILKGLDEAYERTIWYNIPDFFSLAENLEDVLLESGFTSFSFRGYTMSIYEIKDMDMIEFLFKDFNFEFIDSNGFHVGDCQNILLEEMIM